MLSIGACKGPDLVHPPDPIYPIPSQAQLDWQEMEFYAFVHFNMNTFTNQEWGFGDEKPDMFNPTELDCRQWAKVAKDAGMKGIIITAKHHDGFCLWPSEYTEHSVKSSSWKNGQGDVIRELADACNEYGLKLGIYYSPWDRNHADYGTPEYLTYMRNQLRELLTNYGEIFEVWFDGANGGTGYYGGANEERRVDKKTYYDMQNTYPIIRELQPGAVIFSDAGPDVRWVGNEDGWAFETMWSNLLRDSVYAGMPEYSSMYASGQENGSHWVPGETNVSIRPGWYYHEYEDHKVKPLADLTAMYFNSIGRNTTWLLNFPVDKRGLIHERDVDRLEKLTSTIDEQFAMEFANGMETNATNERGPGFEVENIVDGNKDTYWASGESIVDASITIDLNEPKSIDMILIQEYVTLGQRVKKFSIEAKTADDGWIKVADATTIGYKRILRFPETFASSVRLNIEDAKAAPTISNIEIFDAPELLLPPIIRRNKSGEVSIMVPEGSADIYYTLDGSKPTINSRKYTGPFIHKELVSIRAGAISESGTSEIIDVDFDISSEKWKVIQEDENADKIIDGNNDTWWQLPEGSLNNEIVIDLGEILELNGFTYLPMQARWISGFIKDYEFYVSLDNKEWVMTSKGEFGNIQNHPILQQAAFSKRPARYIKMKAISTVGDTPPSFAEIALLTKQILQ
jgi:alpha-L-fucosidase